MASENGDGDGDRRRNAMATMLMQLAALLPPAGQPLPPAKRQQFLTVVERALDYLYDTPEATAPAASLTHGDVAAWEARSLGVDTPSGPLASAQRPGA